MNLTDLPERLASKILPNESSGCWEWTAGKYASGYGMFGVREGVTRGAHRVVYERLVGEVPDGLQLDHLCRNRGCVNPDHLEPVTCRENLLRGIGFSAVNAAKTHCDAGHPFDATNTYVDPRGRRQCRECRRQAMRKFRAAHPGLKRGENVRKAA